MMTNTTDTSRQAAQLIWDAWQAGAVLDRLPGDLEPRTRAEGFAIQAHFETFSGRPPIGWKIAATSTAGQQHIGVSAPLPGRLLAERTFGPGETLAFGANRMAVAEAEFAFMMGETLPPRDTAYTEAEVMAAVAALHSGIELPDSRFRDFARAGEANLIADNACAHEFVLGPAMADAWRDLALAQHATSISIRGGATHEGAGANVLGDPRIALTWLANELSDHGVALAAGEVVTTGTSTVPIPIQAGDAVTADYGILGSLEMAFDAS